MYSSYQLLLSCIICFIGTCILCIFLHMCDNLTKISKLLQTYKSFDCIFHCFYMCHTYIFMNIITIMKHIIIIIVIAHTIMQGSASASGHPHPAGRGRPDVGGQSYGCNAWPCSPVVQSSHFNATNPDRSYHLRIVNAGNHLAYKTYIHTSRCANNTSHGFLAYISGSL